MYTGKYLSLERSGIIGKSRDYNDYCCLWRMNFRIIFISKMCSKNYENRLTNRNFMSKNILEEEVCMGKWQALTEGEVTDFHGKC